MSRWLIPFLALTACAAKPAPAPRALEREHVTKHFVVVVQEPDPRAPEDPLIVRPIAGGPLSMANPDEMAFASEDPRYVVHVAWKGQCLDVVVARSGLAPFDDFAAHGCVKLEGPSTSVASVTGKSGAPIEVLVWTLET